MKEKIKKLLRSVVKIWFIIPFYLCGKLSEKLTYNIFLQAICESIESVIPYYFTYNLRPKQAKQVVSREKVSPNADKFVIIMQGPLIEKNDFTLETVKLYERIYPGVQIIISTWEKENSEYVEQIKKETSCKMILNEYPQFSGFANTNYQMVSTVNGLKEAQRMGKEFAFKTRCDYRFYKKGLLEFMHNMLLAYPCADSLMYQKYRIIMTSGRSDDMFRPFFIGDQFQFGSINDLLSFWEHKLILKNCSLKEFYKWCKKNNFSWKEERKYTSLFSRLYVKKMRNEDIDVSVQAYWDFAKKYLIFLSAKDVDAYWCKYDSKYEETMCNGEFYRNDSINLCLSYNWNFAVWSNLYYGKINYIDEMERISEDNKMF